MCVFVTSVVIITGSSTLKVLDVGCNKFDDDGMLMISEELQHNNLIDLSVERRELSVKGEDKQLANFLAIHYTLLFMFTNIPCDIANQCEIYNIFMIITGAIAVSKLLMGNCSLQELYVCNNNIGDDGISVIAEQLQHITTLHTLNVSSCGLSVKGSYTVLCV